jgi:hypothetical protein
MQAQQVAPALELAQEQDATPQLEQTIIDRK